MDPQSEHINTETEEEVTNRLDRFWQAKSNLDNHYEELESLYDESSLDQYYEELKRLYNYDQVNELNPENGRNINRKHSLVHFLSNLESNVASITRTSQYTIPESPPHELQYTNHDYSSSSEKEEPQPEHPKQIVFSAALLNWCSSGPEDSQSSKQLRRPSPSLRVNKQTNAVRKRSRNPRLTSGISRLARHRRVTRSTNHRKTRNSSQKLL